MQLPSTYPVRLAVQLALLDNLSRGRIDVGVGKGTIYNEYDFVGHGLRSDDRPERMEEAVDIIGRLWGGGPVTYNGKYFQVQVPAIAAPPGAAPAPAALARRDLAILVQRMRPARSADPDGAPAGRTDQGALDGLRGGA